MFSANWWLEDVISFWHGPFFRWHSFIFRGCKVPNADGSCSFCQNWVVVSNIYVLCSPLFWERFPFWRAYFSRWVGSTTNQKIYENMLRLHHKKRGRLTTVNPPQCQKHPGWLQDEREPLAGTGPVGSVQLARGRTCKLIQGLLKGETAEKKNRHLNIPPGK